MKEQTWTFLITELAEQHALIRSATEMQHKILQFYFAFIAALTGVIIYILEKNLPLIEIREDLCYLLGVIVFLGEIIFLWLLTSTDAQYDLTLSIQKIRSFFINEDDETLHDLVNLPLWDQSTDTVYTPVKGIIRYFSSLPTISHKTLISLLNKLAAVVLGILFVWPTTWLSGIIVCVTVFLAMTMLHVSYATWRSATLSKLFYDRVISVLRTDLPNVLQNRNSSEDDIEATNE